MFEFRACAAAVNVWAHIYLLLYLSVRIYILYIYQDRAAIDCTALVVAHHHHVVTYCYFLQVLILR